MLETLLGETIGRNVLFRSHRTRHVPKCSARKERPLGWLCQSLSGARGVKPAMQLLGLRKQVVLYLEPVIGTKVRGC